jgi:uncharacterized protein YmfQ (DUF2313 family)
MAKDYLTDFWQHMPPGKAWERAAEVFNQLFAGLTPEFDRAEARGEDLLREMDPRTTVELLPDWERVAALPDPCSTPPTTIEDRQAALTAKLLARGNADVLPMILATLDALGYGVANRNLRRFHHQPFTCKSPCNAPLNSNRVGWIFVWEFILKHAALDSVAACIVSRIAPAHVGVTFAFPLVFFEDGAFSRGGSDAILTNPVTEDQSSVHVDVMATVFVGEGNNTNIQLIGFDAQVGLDGTFDFSDSDQSAHIPMAIGT